MHECIWWWWWCGCCCVGDAAAEPAGGGVPQVAEFMKLICKVFWSATFMAVPELLLQTEQFSGWMMVLHQAMGKTCPG